MTKIAESVVGPERLTAYFNHGSTQSCVSFIVSNNGDHSVSIVGTGWMREYSDVDDPILTSMDSPFQSPIVVLPDQKVTIAIELELDSPFHTEPEVPSALWTFGNDGMVMRPILVDLRILPEASLVEKSLEIHTPEPVEITFHLSMQGPMGKIMEVTGFDTEWKILQITPRQVELKGTYKPPTTFVSENRMEDLCIRFESVPYDLKETINVKLHRAPELKTQFLDSVRLFPMRSGRTFTAWIQATNIGADPIEILEMTPIQQPGVDVVVAESFRGRRLASLESIAIPIVVGKQTYAEMETDIEVVAGLQIFTNSPVRDVTETTAPCRSEEFRKSNNPIAFDFGTVNSCVATIDSVTMNTQLVEIPVEVSERQYALETILPSVMRLESAPIGDSSKYLPFVSLLSARVDGVVVKNMKSSFCHGEDVIFEDFEGVKRTIESEILVTRYLQHLIDEVEQIEEKRFDECVATVPTKYGKVPLQKMKACLSAVGFDDSKIHVYDEATSAALYFIRQGRGHGVFAGKQIPENYSIAIMDIGGGTTDISILDVSDSEDGDRRKLSVTLRGTTGRAKFGGIHFNDRLQNRWIRDYCNFAESKVAGSLDLNQLDPTQKQEFSRHTACLPSAIERAKCGIGNRTDEPYTGIDDALTLSSILTTALNIEDSTPDEPPDHLLKLTKEILQEELGADLDDILDELKLMIDSLAKNPLGMCLLVGQSSRLKIIQDRVKDVFGEDVFGIVPGDEAKTCVVSGALDLFQLLKRPGSVDFQFTDLSDVVPARIGILWAGKYGLEFRELIAVGSSLPASGKITLPASYLKEGTLRSLDVMINFGARNEVKGNQNLKMLGRYLIPDSVRNVKMADSVDFHVETDVNMELDVAMIANETSYPLPIE